MAAMTDVAERSDTSCSPDLPPNKTATRNFFILFLLQAAGYIILPALPECA